MIKTMTEVSSEKLADELTAYNDESFLIELIHEIIKKNKYFGFLNRLHRIVSEEMEGAAINED